MWNEAGESEEAYDEALRVISEAEAKIASAALKSPSRTKPDSLDTFSKSPASASRAFAPNGLEPSLSTCAVRIPNSIKSIWHLSNNLSPAR